MADVFQLTGSYMTRPTSGGAPSGDPSLEAVIDESISLKKKLYREYLLEADAVQAIDFGGLAAGHVIVIKLVGGKAKVRLTSADGATQAVPVDSFFVVIADSVPFTALDLTRQAGIEVTAKIFIGEKA